MKALQKHAECEALDLGYVGGMRRKLPLLRDQKSIALLSFLRTLTRNSSASFIAASVSDGVTPQLQRCFSGTAFNATFFIPALLLVLHPVILYRAGRTNQK